MEFWARNFYPDKTTKKSITIVFVPDRKKLFTFDEQGFPALNTREEIEKFYERAAAYYVKDSGSPEGEFTIMKAR